MLSLRLPVVDGGEAAVVPLSEAAALAFERALLAATDVERLVAIEAALAVDATATSWALRVAEVRLSRAVNHSEEAAALLSGRLASELAVSLSSDARLESEQLASWRLPRLAARIHALESAAAEFEKRLEHEKLESLKELAYGASHEINNPLANIAARAQTLLAGEADLERQRKLMAIHRQAMRAHEMIADLMLFARPPKLVLKSCDLNALVRTVVAESKVFAGERQVELAVTCGDTPVVASVDATQLAVAIGAVVKNGVEAAETGGHVGVSVGQIAESGRQFAEMRVRDDGPGISDEVRRHMFDPFFSGREAGRGLGFGLSKCWRIVTDHGGEVFAEKRADGAEFVIRLPLAHS